MLLEFQSTIDRTMALRMTDYTVRILRSLKSSALGPGGEYPPILAILLYNGERRWNAATDIGDLFPPAPEELLAYLPRQRYLGADLRAFRFTELPLESSLGLMARFEQAESLERLAGLLAWLPEWEQAGGDPKLLSPIWTWATRVLAQRPSDKGAGLETRLRIKEGAEMTTLFDRARQWGDELNREWLAKGIARGERALVRRLVARQFGSEAADELAPVLDGISDPDRLTAIAAEVFSCGTVEELVDRAQNA